MASKMQANLVLLLVTSVLSTGRTVANEEIPMRWFIRLSGSLDPSQTTVAYINGTVYARRPGFKLDRLFLYEGFNIAHQIPHPNGSFWGETREIVFYRDPVSRAILGVWENPYSSSPNEVFIVDNDPVNFKTIRNHTHAFNFPFNGPLCVANDFVLQYPNPLDVENYTKYSAGPVYQATELFQYHGNYTAVSNETVLSARMTITWTRKSQWLPWMAMGKTPGELYTVAFSWKLVNGVDDLPKDILALVTKKYPKWLKPPATYEVPNESSWVTFKKVIDSRRAKGEPDIMIAPQNVTKLKSFSTFVDPSLVQAIVSQTTIYAAWNGTLLPDILNVTAFPLLHFTGHAEGRVSIAKGGYVVSLNASGEFRDPLTLEILTHWLNPITKSNVAVPTFSYSGKKFIGADWVSSFDIPPRNEIGLIGVLSSTTKDGGAETWMAEFYEVLFKNGSLKAPNSGFHQQPSFYGTWSRFSSWLPWMEMNHVPGSLISRLHIYPSE